jgi:hypothetical protein
MALAIIAEALILWCALIYKRAAVVRSMDISRWYALTTPLGAGVFTAMMLTLQRRFTLLRRFEYYYDVLR